MGEEREILIEGQQFKFSCAHFVAYQGYREKLHGHNYTVSVKLGGPLGPDGYVIDFGIVKKSLRKECKILNEAVLIPMQSDVLDIRVVDITSVHRQVEIRSETAFFSLPESDCVLLPIVHSTAEELAQYLFSRLVNDIPYLQERSIAWMEVSVSERPGQSAVYRNHLAHSN